MTLEFVKNSYNAVCFFKEVIRKDVNITTASVNGAAQDIGTYIMLIINANTRNAGTFLRNFSMYLLFCNPIKSKQPDAISQNLDCIKKYASD